jgi:hypothetical protein
MSDFLKTLPLTKSFLEGYQSKQSTHFPSGGKIHYDSVLQSTHDYLNEHVHQTVQQRAAIENPGIYLTDHGPKHIELVLSRASNLVRTAQCIKDEDAGKANYESSLRPYEVFLLTLAIHFHDVGNMYGRDGHEQNIKKVMDQIGVLQPMHWPEKNWIANIAMCHGGKFEGDPDTIRSLAAGSVQDGTIKYRPQLLAAVLRLADELADEHSRADSFGLIEPQKLPPTCLIYQKYAEALTVSINPLEGQIGLEFNLKADDLRKPFKKMVNGKTKPVKKPVFLLDEIYERTLKTYTEMVYCGRYMRCLETHLHEVRVDVKVYEDPRQSIPTKGTSFTYTIGDSEYPNYKGDTRDALKRLARGFKNLKTGQSMADFLNKPSKK